MPFGDKIKELRGKQGLLFIPLYIFYKCLKNIIPIDKSSPTDDNFSPTDSRFTQIYDLSGKWSNRISKVALTKTIKTPNSIFRKLSLYIVRRNSLSESKLSSIDLLQTMSQSMLCFLKIQLGDIHEKHNHNFVVHQVTYYNVFV